VDGFGLAVRAEPAIEFTEGGFVGTTGVRIVLMISAGADWGTGFI
jgi:hypothetical protein